MNYVGVLYDEKIERGKKERFAKNEKNRKIKTFYLKCHMIVKTTNNIL